jgi:hypothetical protein
MGQLSAYISRAAMALVAGGIVLTPAVHAKSASNVVLLAPANLPASAQQAGDAMLLHDTVDGRTLLYIEQNQGARLATLDVTDPAHIKDENSVPLSASGAFDFVSPLGDQAELIRFRRGQDAVLNLPRLKNPSLSTVQGVPLLGSVMKVSSNDIASIGQATDDAQLLSASSDESERAFDAKHIRAQITKADTGTTFTLTDNGLYVLRRPAVESLHQLMIIPPN